MPSSPTPEPAPEDAVLGVMSRAVGTRSPELGMLWLNQACGTLPGPQDGSADESLAIALPALQGIAPRDEIEGMLAVQLVAVHNLSLQQLRRASQPDQPQAIANAAANNAAKLLRAFSQQLAALNRYRGKGQQKITVEHVDVHSGGQAIVGCVERGRGEQG
jgi:hypothetical protein